VKVALQAQNLSNGTRAPSTATACGNIENRHPPQWLRIQQAKEKPVRQMQRNDVRPHQQILKPIPLAAKATKKRLPLLGLNGHARTQLSKQDRCNQTSLGQEIISVKHKGVTFTKNSPDSSPQK
jgi:hypothetical protein